ncbi:MAG: DUF4258 domain-containing protein [Anaerolineae bacterium]|nr:DUF4258 domain-containing protein [Anaerolineae bacterium]
MAYTITANNKTYTVDPHAAQRMLQCGISEAWVIETLETGAMTTQANNRDRYELQKWDDEWEETVIIQVIVEEANLLVVTVIDDTLFIDEADF